MNATPLAALALLSAAPLAPLHACEEEAVMGAMTAHLFYKESGRLSEDLLARDYPFIGWNTVIGEGDAAEAADDLAVVVRIETVGQAYLPEQLDIWVTDENDGELGRRRFDGLLTSDAGQLANVLWLNDVTCAGVITLHAKFRGEEKTATLQLECGE